MFEGNKEKEEEEEVVRFPIKRLEPTINKFIKVVEIDLERLQRHRLNISKYTVAEDWEALDKEQINATRTVQQIKANLREIEHARDKTALEDLPRFDQRVEETKQAARQAVHDFIAMATPNEDAADLRSAFGVSRSESFPEEGPVRSSSGISKDAAFPWQPGPASLPASLPAAQSEELCDGAEASCGAKEEGDAPGMQTLQVQTALHVAPDHVPAAASWEHLQESLADLNSMMASFATAVKGQGEAVDRIEDNVEKADADITEGTNSLAKAAKYKAAIFPVAGAAIGTVVGGPVGLFLGLKIGGLVAVGGGFAGFMGGKLLKKRQDKATNVEMQNLKERRSNSLPDISKTDSC